MRNEAKIDNSRRAAVKSVVPAPLYVVSSAAGLVSLQTLQHVATQTSLAHDVSHNRIDLRVTFVAAHGADICTRCDLYA